MHDRQETGSVAALSALTGFLFCWWKAEQKGVNVREGRAAPHLATILGALPGQFTNSHELFETERGGGGREEME